MNKNSELVSKLFKGCRRGHLCLEYDVEAAEDLMGDAALRIQALEAALTVAREYMSHSLGSPQYKGPDPYPIIDAAIGKLTP